MRKILVVCAALMLPCLLVHAQEADNTDGGIVLNIVPKAELNQSISTVKGGNDQLDLGSSSLYTLFEGNLTDNLSFSVSNHWLARYPRVKDLYKNTWCSDDVNWVDWAYLTYNAGKFEFTAGKQVVTTGGFEAEDYDYDAHALLNTGIWNGLQTYQWGGKVAFNMEDNTTLAVQVTTSPYGHRPFKSGLYNYSVEWRGQYGIFETITSVTSIQTQKSGNGVKFNDCFLKLLSVGARANLDPVVITLDVFNKVGTDEGLLLSGATVAPSVLWTVSDKVELLAKCSYERTKNPGAEWKKNAVNAGAGVHWRPLDCCKGLRLHLTGSYNSRYELATISAGVLYNLSLKVK